MKTFDQIWIRIVKVGGFCLGFYIMYHEAIYDNSDRPYLYAAALAMMGSQIGESFGKFLDAASTILSVRKGLHHDEEKDIHTEPGQLSKGE